MIKTLKAKVSIVYLGLVILIAVIGTASIINLFNLGQSINGLMVDNYKSINAINNMIEAIERQDSAILTYIHADHQKGLDLFLENNQTYLKWYNVEAGNITESGEKLMVRDIAANYTVYTKLFSQLQEIKNIHGVSDSDNFYDTQIYPVFMKLKTVLKDLSLLNEKAMFNGRDQAIENSAQSMNIIVVMTIAALIGGFAASRYFTNRFMRPISALTETIKLVKAGDLNQQANIMSQDEIGELAVEFNNMTKRLQLYEQSALGRLMAEKNKTLAIVKSIADPLIVLDSDYHVMLLNNACESIFDIKEAKVTNKHFLEVIRNEELFDFILDNLETKEESRQKIIHRSHEQEEYYFNVIVKSIKDNDAHLTGFIIAFQNITRLKQLEKIRTDFIATISHEFKTPLTSIMMGTDLMLGDGIGILNDEQIEIINTIKEDGERLSTLVNDLLELTRIESGKTVFKIEPCRIDGIIESSIKQFYHIAEKKDVSLYFECDENLPRVKADYEKITWVINNLISNALKYTNAGDEIAVSAFVKGVKMHVKVKDTGVGIPEEYLDKIFEKFVQVKGGDLEVRGTGLGLAVVKEIISIHNGTIWCESRLDSGSIFTFTLEINDR
jgi:PAS domain S-box-containing protein